MPNQGTNRLARNQELKDVNSIPGYDVKPQYVNRFHVVCDPSHVRIIMGDMVATGRTRPSLRGVDDDCPANTSDLLLKLIEQSGLLQQEGKPNILYNVARAA